LAVTELRKRFGRHFELDLERVHFIHGLDSSWSSSFSVALFDRNRLYDTLRFGTNEIDREQSILQVGTRHFDPIRQHESTLELPGGDAAMDVVPCFVVLLPAANDELVLLYG
jgi:hypothetical protein